VGRLFRDLQGWLNQDLARAANSVYQVVAGIPIPIKRPEGKP
jgi:adenosyl cobinamide kinase/adenosyl cobinamide phosphate guanylyltransferase